VRPPQKPSNKMAFFIPIKAIRHKKRALLGPFVLGLAGVAPNYLETV
jgi:hypothetical protein